MGLLSHGERSGPRLLVLSPSDQRYRDLLTRYHAICAMVGPLPPPKVVSTDHGYQRFLLFALPAQRQPGPCIAPAMAWIDTPLPGVAATTTMQVRGWAFKDGVGLSRVELLVDGRPAGRADYGATLDVRPYWKISNDPQHPRVGFTATLDTRADARHALVGLAPARPRRQRRGLVGAAIHRSRPLTGDWPT